MKQILTIFKREYLVRVKKKSFIIITLLGPLLIAAFYGVIALIAYNQIAGGEQRIVQVYDASGTFRDQLKNNNQVIFSYLPTDKTYEETRKGFYSSDAEVMVYIPPTFTAYRNNGLKVASRKDLGLKIDSEIKDELSSAVKNMRLQQAGLQRSTIDSLEVRLEFDTDVIAETGESKISSSGVRTAAGMVAAFVIYLFIFIYGSMVMRGVLEEKTNRIVEVIITSVKPFQLMMGKILGVALVGITQLIVWGVLSTLFIFLISIATGININAPEYIGPEMDSSAMTNKMNELAAQIATVDWWNMFFVFVFYFTGGYLIYSALFAAVAAAVDAETDTQQFMFPISLPLIFAIVIAQTAISTDPHSTLVTWFSLIPFTSPVVMMARLPFDVPVWELVLSMVLLVAGFVFTVFIAGRIYRTGILLYGKKATYKELFKWIFYKY